MLHQSLPLHPSVICRYSVYIVVNLSPETSQEAFLNPLHTTGEAFWHGLLPLVQG